MASMFGLFLAGSMITLVLPFCTKVLIDKGVLQQNLQLVHLILLAQLALTLGSILLSAFRNWVMLNVGTRIGISVISEFLKKLVSLPIKFFEIKMLGDFHQRIDDNDRIEEFLSSQGILTFFSLITFTVFFAILWYFDTKILLCYSLLTIASLCWSFHWLKKRKELDYHKFQGRTENQESVYEILNGIVEMKLNQFEHYKISQWEKIQEKLFKVNLRILKVDQLQLSGFEFINNLKNVLVTYLGAVYVIEGQMTFGTLLSISYIIGEMNSPINQLVTFFRSLQDAKLSLERLNEVHTHVSEEDSFIDNAEENTNENRPLTEAHGSNEEIKLSNVYFKYGGELSNYVLRDINLSIPEGKITALVGYSGSGKTTLMKLLLSFYPPTEGDIFFGGTNLYQLSPKQNRARSGVVMQDGYIFSDTVERNIVTGDEVIDYRRLEHAVRLANMGDFVSTLPMKLKTKIGAAGNNLSGGQKQRILIARAIYKDPKYIFLDEATSALDAENERIIQENLNAFFKGRTVIIIAHRLSTVKNADKIVVLNQGKITEEGTHYRLIDKKGDYYKLVSNQLELGK